jgi:hypothetical protein
MKYQNMKVQTVESGSLAPTEQDFMEHWNSMVERRTMLNRMLQPGLEAIRVFHYPRGGSVLLDTFELVEYANKDRAVAYTIQLYVNGNISTTTFTIPLSAIMKGYKEVISFFEEEQKLHEEHAREAGRRREAADKESRKKLFDELKLEFDPPKAAIVKRD